MNSLRIARAAARLRPSSARLSVQRRGYAEAVSDKIKLTLALPHQVRGLNQTFDCGVHVLRAEEALLITVANSQYTSPQMCE